MAPYDYEMYPKVQNNLRVQKCNLGLWNKDSVVSNDLSSDTFAIGQNFIRRYNMTIMSTERAESNDISMHIYIGDATNQIPLYLEISYMLVIVLSLLGYVGYFSVLKFRRQKKEKT